MTIKLRIMKAAQIASLCLAFVVFAIRLVAQEHSPSLHTIKLQGIWDLVYQQTNGKKLPDEKTAARLHGKMVLTEDKIRYTVDLPKFDFEFSYRLYADQNPSAIDLKITDTPDKNGIGTKLLGIYVIEGRNLKICYNKTTRPAEFMAEKGSHNTLIVLTRVEGVGPE
ncbi:MAG TPA: TIGR03067 domain-containing protein [Candidatus Saccharimonadales bacterium]|nr:TIGR03067 domain-containing protein [Candidatus Saccharimonadales bacterium]